MNEPSQVEDGDPLSWLRAFAKDRFKHGAGVRARLIVVADLLEQTMHVRDMQGAMLTDIVNTLKGQPEPGTMHGMQDVVQIIEDLMRQTGRKAEPSPELH